MRVSKSWMGPAAAGAGLLMMCYGIFRGEAAVVLTKAMYGVYWNWIERR